MAFTSAITRSNRIGSGWRCLVEGTWVTTNPTTSGDIDLSSYIKRIESCAVWTTVGTGCTRWRPNYTVAAVATPGNLAILACTTADGGGFWAEGVLA
jgi:hypothetical protein